MGSGADDRIISRASKWLEGNFDEETKKLVKDMMENDLQGLTEAFHTDLEFGTGGLRGIMGAGTNRMNKYTVGMATQGLANYIKAAVAGAPAGIAIAYDSRNNSRFFAQVTADVMSANDIKVFLFSELRPTPELSFAIRHLGCVSGIVITASHNPKEYNGYKVYWSDGGQLVSPQDKNVIAEVRKISSINEVCFEAKPELIEMIDADVDEAYLKNVMSLSLNPQLIQKHHELKIVYTPIHGSGITLVPQALKCMGFDDVHVLQAQAVPDGNFPTVKSPNPEEPSALALAIQKANETGASLVLATDPDADRVGVAVKNNKGEFILLNGNQTASILTAYLLGQWKEKGLLRGKEFIVKTIVTSELLKDIATHYNVESFDVLTGFKYIAEIIQKLEGEKVFIGGGEESYGFLVGDFVRDKDAVIACCMIAEAAAYALEKGLSLFDMLQQIYVDFGFYYEGLLSLTKKGISGTEEIAKMMAGYRTQPPHEINNRAVVRIMDYKLQKETDVKTGLQKDIKLPVSDVLQFFLDDGSKITVRPSGTEPKIKFYFGIKGVLENASQFEETETLLKQKISDLIVAMKLQ
ncbi:MAG: phospho-sugar mutase [Bacteroidota bacterium]